MDSEDSQVLTARGAEEESVGYLPSKMTELRVGQALQGIVTQVRERIALVDIGVEKVGLLPISKLLDGRAPDRVSEVLQEGDPITVYVAEVINPQEPRSRDSKLVLAGHKNKIVNLMQFGNRSNIEDVKAVAEAQKEKVYYKGLVTAVKDIGVVVAFRIPDVPGITSGLVYKTEVQGAPDIMSEVQVRILEVLIESRRRQVKLSMRDEDPLAGRAARFGDFRDMVEKTVKGKVTGFQDYGAFVEVVSDSGTTQRALLPNGEIKADRVPQDPAEVLEVGQELNLKILEITEKGIRVSQKEAEA